MEKLLFSNFVSRNVFSTTILMVLLLFSCVSGSNKKLDSKKDELVNRVSIYGQINDKAPTETLQFGQFVGEWDCEISNLNSEGKWINSKAKWTWKYILDGYGIQDFWENPTGASSDQGPSKLLGTNIRVFNIQQNKWLNSWTENATNTMSGIWEATMLEDESIEMHDRTGDWMITFYNIDENNFDWKWNFKQDDGTMKTTSKIEGKRLTK